MSRDALPNVTHAAEVLQIATGEEEDVCRQIYAETARLYASLAPRMEKAARLGFRVLYGPPIVEAPFLFVGHQPGGGASAETPEHHEGWPAHCDYAHENWHLARRIREVWGKERVERCTGLNAIFLRAPTIKHWERVPKAVRAKVEDFSASRAKRLICALRPKRIVVIGLGAFAMLTSGAVVRQSGARILVRRGELWGAPAYGIIHLSGARISQADLGVLRCFFRTIFRLRHSPERGRRRSLTIPNWTALGSRFIFRSCPCFQPSPSV